MSPRAKVVIGLAAASVSVVLMASLLLQTPSGSATPQGDGGPRTPADETKAQRGLAGPEVSAAPSREGLPPSDDSPTGGHAETHPAAGSPTREGFASSFRSAVEKSISGTFDLDAFLDLALALADLEASPRAVPEPGPGGAIRFPFVGAPEGMSGELWIRHTNNREFAREVLSIKLAADREAESPLVEGVPRDPPETEITIWTDREGRLKHFAFLTDMDLDAPACRRLGIPFEQGEIPRGFFYSYSLDDPSKRVANLGGYAPGKIGDLDRAVTVWGDPQRRMKDLERLASRMRQMHQSLKQ